MVTVLGLVRIIISFKSAHQIQCRDALLGVVWNTIFNIHESASLYELVCIFVDSCVLVIDLYLVERVVSHSASVNDESSLSDAPHFLLLVLIIIVIVVGEDAWEYSVGFADYLEWLKFSVLADGNESPVIKATLPEFTEIN